MQRDCSSLKVGEQVVFNIHSDIYGKKIPETGTVEYLSLDRKEVHVNWLEGYKDRHDVISFEDMIAVYNENGEMMKWPGISGSSDLLCFKKEKNMREEIKNFVDTHLKRFDLEGVEITEEDYDYIEEDVKGGKSISDACMDTMQRIRDCLDEGLEDEEEIGE